VRVYSGATGALIREWFGTQAEERFGASLGAGGDVDGDGLPDLLAGATGYDVDSTHERTGRVAVLSPRAKGSEHYGDDTPGCAGGHLLSLGQPASPGGVFDVRASGLTPQATPVLVVTLGRLEPPVPILGNVLLHVNLVLLAEGLQLPSANGHLIAPLPIPNGPSWTGLEVDAQIVFVWPGGCPALARPFSATNAIEVTIE